MKAENDSTCPSNIGFVWEYYNSSNWIDAGNGIVIRCESDNKLEDFYTITGVALTVLLIIIGAVAAFFHIQETLLPK